MPVPRTLTGGVGLCARRTINPQHINMYPSNRPSVASSASGRTEKNAAVTDINSPGINVATTGVPQLPPPMIPPMPRLVRSHTPSTRRKANSGCELGCCSLCMGGPRAVFLLHSSCSTRHPQEGALRGRRLFSKKTGTRYPANGLFVSQDE